MCELCILRAVGLPQKRRGWRVRREAVGNSIRIYASGDGMCFSSDVGRDPSATYVKTPNYIERIVGITMERKIKKAERKAQKYCDRGNEEINTEIALCKKWCQNEL